MSKFAELIAIVEKNKKDNDIKTLDAKASYIILENCINYLNINNMPELEEVKSEIRKTMKKLRDISRNGEEKQKTCRTTNTTGNC